MVTTNGHTNGLIQEPSNQGKAEDVLTGVPMSLGYRPTIQSLAMWDEDAVWTGAMLRDVERMRIHPAVRAPYGYYKSGIASVQFEIKNAASKVEEFLTNQYQSAWERYLHRMQNVYDYGWLGMEAVYRTDRQGLMELAGLHDFHPLDVWAVTRNGRYRGIAVSSGAGTLPSAGGQVRLTEGRIGLWGPGKWPAKGLWLTHNQRFDRFYGWSQLLGAWIPWSRLAKRDGLEEVMDQALYRFGYKGPVGRYPSSAFRKKDGGGSLDYDAARNAMREVCEQGKSGVSVALPSDLIPGTQQYQWDLEWPDHTISVQGLLEPIDSLKKEISLGVDVPPELLEAAETGSGWSGRKVPLLAFYSGQVVNARNFAWELKRQIFDRLVDWNFGPGHTHYTVHVKLSLPPDIVGQQGSPPAGMPQQPGVGQSNPLAALMGNGDPSQQQAQQQPQQGQEEEQGGGQGPSLGDGSLFNLGPDEGIELAGNVWIPWVRKEGVRKGQPGYKNVYTGEVRDQAPQPRQSGSAPPQQLPAGQKFSAHGIDLVGRKGGKTFNPEVNPAKYGRATHPMVAQNISEMLSGKQKVTRDSLNALATHLSQLQPHEAQALKSSLRGMKLSPDTVKQGQALAKKVAEAPAPAATPEAMNAPSAPHARTPARLAPAQPEAVPESAMTAPSAPHARTPAKLAPAEAPTQPARTPAKLAAGEGQRFGQRQQEGRQEQQGLPPYLQDAVGKMAKQGLKAHEIAAETGAPEQAVRDARRQARAAPPQVQQKPLGNEPMKRRQAELAAKQRKAAPAKPPPEVQPAPTTVPTANVFETPRALNAKLQQALPAEETPVAPVASEKGERTPVKAPPQAPEQPVPAPQMTQGASLPTPAELTPPSPLQMPAPPGARQQADALVAARQAQLQPPEAQPVRGGFAGASARLAEVSRRMMGRGAAQPAQPTSTPAQPQAQAQPRESMAQRRDRLAADINAQRTQGPQPQQTPTQTPETPPAQPQTQQTAPEQASAPQQPAPAPEQPQARQAETDAAKLGEKYPEAWRGMKAILAMGGVPRSRDILATMPGGSREEYDAMLGALSAQHQGAVSPEPQLPTTQSQATVPEQPAPAPTGQVGQVTFPVNEAVAGSGVPGYGLKEVPLEAKPEPPTAAQPPTMTEAQVAQPTAAPAPAPPAGLTADETQALDSFKNPEQRSSVAHFVKMAKDAGVADRIGELVDAGMWPGQIQDAVRPLIGGTHAMSLSPMVDAMIKLRRAMRNGA